MSGVDGEVLRRHFVAIATGRYDDPTCPSLDVTAEVSAVRRWLCDSDLGERQFAPRHPELAANPTKNQIRAVLEDPPADLVWRDSDAAVVFITGHGITAHDTHYLVLRTTDTARLNATAIRSSDLIAWLADTRIRHLLVILDACYAGRVAIDTLRLDRDLPDTWLVLPSATRNQEAVAGALTTAISAFLTELASDRGQQYGVGPYLTVEDFLDGVQERLGRGQVLQPVYGARRRQPHVCLPNPHYRAAPVVPVTPARRDLALPRQDLQTHWAPRARGVASDDDPGWLFTGRADLMRALIAATTGPAGATVVAGGAGSGKSAVLARLVTLADPQFLRWYPEEVSRIPPGLRPPVGAVDVAAVATGKLHTQVLAQVCHALGVPAPASAHAEPTVAERLAAWHGWLATRRDPVTIVVDALDEAADPRVLVRDVLARLEPDPHRPRLRLLVSVRSLAATDSDEQPSYTSKGQADLADVTEAALGAERLAADTAPWWDQAELVAYIDSVLRHTAGSPYAAAPTAVTAAVASALGSRTGRSFLIARIAASSLAARDAVVDADDPAWRTALDRGLVGVFRQDLHDSLADPADRRRAVILLRAVAFARGAGLPWRGIWPRVAHAVDDDDGHYGDSDIAWLLNSRLGGYLVTDQADDVTVYRLFHDLLRTTLRERWRDLLAPSPG
jgi:hypothetical protein